MCSTRRRLIRATSGAPFRFSERISSVIVFSPWGSSTLSQKAGTRRRYPQPRGVHTPVPGTAPRASAPKQKQRPGPRGIVRQVWRSRPQRQRRRMARGLERWARREAASVALRVSGTALEAIIHTSFAAVVFDPCHRAGRTRVACTTALVWRNHFSCRWSTGFCERLVMY